MLKFDSKNRKAATDVLSKGANRFMWDVLTLKVQKNDKTLSSIKVVRIIVRVTFLVCIGCLVVMTSSYLPSDKYIFFSLLPLLIPICFFFLLGSMIVLALLRQWKFAVFPLVLLVASIGNSSSHRFTLLAPFKARFRHPVSS